MTRADWLLALGTTLALSASAATQAANAPWSDVTATGLTKDQAQRVLRLVLQHQKIRVDDPKISIDDSLSGPTGDPDRPGYWGFSVSFDNPKAGAIAYLGEFDINMRTGDAWDVESCIRFDFPKLREAQQAIMARTGGSLQADKAARDEVGCR
jgi:hypothetical protein